MKNSHDSVLLWQPETVRCKQQGHFKGNAPLAKRNYTYGATPIRCTSAANPHHAKRPIGIDRRTTRPRTSDKHRPNLASDCGTRKIS